MDKLRGLVLVIACLLVLGGCKKTESWIGSTVKIATEEATGITYNSAVLHGRLLSKGLVIEGDGHTAVTFSRSVTTTVSRIPWSTSTSMRPRMTGDLFG